MMDESIGFFKSEKNEIVNTPLMVTIRCITYNHKPYIRQCLEGFVMQNTNFRFEAIVHDDASTDGTAAIIREYAEKYPDIIKPIYETENQYSKHDGSLDRIMDAHMHGKYIALCEGDDYWIDPLKLQKQVDFLESHSECGLVYSRAQVLRGQEYGVITGYKVKGFKDLLLRGNRIPSLTVCFVHEIWKEYVSEVADKQYGSWKMGDYPMWLYFSQRTKVHFFEDVTSVYRILPESASHSKNVAKMVQFCESICDIRLFFLEKFYDGNDFEVMRRQIVEDKIWGVFRFYLLFDMESKAFEYLRCNKNGIYGKRKVVGFLLKYSSFIRSYLKEKWKMQM